MALRLSGALAMWGQQTPLCLSLAIASVQQSQEVGLCCLLFQEACPSSWASTGQATVSLELGIQAGFLVTILASVSYTLSSASLRWSGC